MDSPIIKLKPGRLHVQMNGDVTVDYEYFLLNARPHSFRISLPHDQLTKAVNSLNVWTENRLTDRTPTVVLPSPPHGVDFPLKTNKFEPLQCNIGSHVEIDVDDKFESKGKKVSGILRNVTYERRFNIVNVVLEDTQKPGTFIVHSMEANFQGDIRITPHTQDYEIGIDTANADALIHVDGMEEDRTGMYGTLRASFKVTTPTVGKGFDISYRLSIIGNNSPSVGHVRKGELECYALFENPLPENLEDVKVTFEVSPTEMLNPSDPTHLFRTDKWKIPDLTGYELFMPNKMAKPTDEVNDASSEGSGDEATTTTNNSIQTPMYYDLKSQLSLRNIALESKKLISVLKNKSEKVLLSKATVNTQVLHMFALKPLKRPRSEEIANIEMYIWESDNDLYIPGFVNITYSDHSPRTYTGYMDKSGFVILEAAFSVRPAVRCIQVSTFTYDQECEMNGDIPHVCISDGDLCINEPVEDTIKIFLTNEGSSNVHVGLPFIRPSHERLLRSIEAIQYKSDNDVAGDNQIGAIHKRGKLLHIKKMSIYNHDHVVFAKVEGNKSSVVIIKTKLYAEYSLYIKDITMDDIESLAKWDDVNDYFVDYLRQLYHIELELNEKRRERFHLFKRLGDLRANRTHPEKEPENDEDISETGDERTVHDTNDTGPSSVRKRKEAIKRTSDQFDVLCHDLCELETKERRLRFELHNVPYKSILNSYMSHRTVRRVKSAFPTDNDEDGLCSEGTFKLRQMRAALSRQSTL